MGGRCADELFWTKLYEEYCPVMHLTTDDGSCGTKGYGFGRTAGTSCQRQI